MVLLMAVFSGLWFDGGGAAYGVLGPLQYTAWISVLAQSENGSLVLAGAALVSGIVALFLGVIVSQLAFVRLLGSWIGGMRSSLFPIVILLLAWSLKTVCDDLHTGGFIAAVMQGLVSALWFPAIVFIIAGITAFATGTSWGTMAILLPTLVPVAHVLDGGTYGVTTAIVCAAILDGAIMGDHCSPISDTTIMSSIASGSDHLDHVRTQLPYALLVGVLAVCCGYIPAALGWPTWFSLLLATLAIILVHQKLGKNCFWAGRVRSHLDP
jgi:Na+/H+ antiporter NhaC